MARYTISTSDKDDFLCMAHGDDFLLTLWDMDQWLRGKIKYNYDEFTSEQVEALQKAREQLWELLDERNLSLDMLR